MLLFLFHFVAFEWLKSEEQPDSSHCDLCSLVKQSNRPFSRPCGGYLVDNPERTQRRCIALQTAPFGVFGHKIFERAMVEGALYEAGCLRSFCMLHSSKRGDPQVGTRELIGRVKQPRLQNTACAQDACAVEQHQRRSHQISTSTCPKARALTPRPSITILVPLWFVYCVTRLKFCRIFV